MQFKKGMGWKACFDEETGRYTAECGGAGNYDLYEITKEIYDALGKTPPKARLPISFILIPDKNA